MEADGLVGGGLEADWRLVGGWLKADWRRIGGGLEADWRRIGGCPTHLIECHTAASNEKLCVREAHVQTILDGLLIRSRRDHRAILALVDFGKRSHISHAEEESRLFHVCCVRGGRGWGGGERTVPCLLRARGEGMGRRRADCSMFAACAGGGDGGAGCESGM